MEYYTMSRSLQDKVKNNWIQFKFRLIYLYRLYILKEYDCDNCRYFGGCCCDHIDENGNCLGWESAGFHPIEDFKYRRMIRRLVRQAKKQGGIVKR